MKSNPTMIFFCMLLVLFFGTCGCENSSKPAEPLVHIEPSPAPDSSVYPYLVIGDSGLYLSWLHQEGQGYLLQYAMLNEQGWGTAQTIAQGKDWFVNWADFPSMQTWKNGRLVAHYLQMSGEGTYDYDVNLILKDKGIWSSPQKPYADQSLAEHGFVSLFPAEHAMGIAWLDGRAYAHAKADGDEGGGMMSLRYAEMDSLGHLGPDRLIDERVCDCCQTDAAIMGEDAILVYRDRSEEEIRDIAYVIRRQGVWSTPRTVYEDNWQISGCPVNGPAVAAQGNEVIITWFSQPQSGPSVKFCRSSDGGQHFSDPVRVDQGKPLGRVDVAMLEDGRSFICWVEQKEGEAELRLSLYSKDGNLLHSMRIDSYQKQRGSGFPRIAIWENKVYLAWTQDEEVERIAISSVDISP